MQVLASVLLGRLIHTFHSVWLDVNRCYLEADTKCYTHSVFHSSDIDVIDRSRFFKAILQPYADHHSSAKCHVTVLGC